MFSLPSVAPVFPETKACVREFRSIIWQLVHHHHHHISINILSAIMESTTTSVIFILSIAKVIYWQQGLGKSISTHLELKGLKGYKPHCYSYSVIQIIRQMSRSWSNQTNQFCNDYIMQEFMKPIIHNILFGLDENAYNV